MHFSYISFKRFKPLSPLVFTFCLWVVRARQWKRVHLRPCWPNLQLSVLPFVLVMRAVRVVERHVLVFAAFWVFVVRPRHEILLKRTKISLSPGEKFGAVQRMACVGRAIDVIESRMHSLSASMSGGAGYAAPRQGARVQQIPVGVAKVFFF